MRSITEIEARWKEVTGLQHLDLTTPHFTEGDGQQQKTTKEEYENWDFVCTPLWMVDNMLENLGLELETNTTDACCGCGQFSIRILRKMLYKYPCDFDVDDWLRNHHTFTEFQFSNVAKLIYVFGPDINVYVGDSLNLKYHTEEEKGILFFDYKKKCWFNLPKLKEMLDLHKDDLGALIGMFTTFEERLMPPPKPKKVKKQKAKAEPEPKAKPTPPPPPPQPPAPAKKADDPQKLNSAKEPAPVTKKQASERKTKYQEVAVTMKIGGKYNPTILFDDV